MVRQLSPWTNHVGGGELYRRVYTKTTEISFAP